jgi:hypothetical protein
VKASKIDRYAEAYLMFCESKMLGIAEVYCIESDINLGVTYVKNVKLTVMLEWLNFSDKEEETTWGYMIK